MQLAMIGLGKMGANMARRLARNGHEVIAYDVNPATAQALADESERISAAASLAECFERQDGASIIWLMIPHHLVDEMIDQLHAAGLSAGDIVIDGGNSNFNLSRERGRRLAEQQVHFIDSGTSGGVWGLDNGYSLMVGGDEQAVKRIEPLLKSLAPTGPTCPQP